MTELAYEPAGITRRGALNPWRVSAIAGGSSTGSAILVGLRLLLCGAGF
jgi:Asp-tRNA(Asn)/Glu-tRNA(Gln) amidotransferase A subunit family amidase